MVKRIPTPTWARKIQPTLELISPVHPKPRWSHFRGFSIGLLDQQKIPFVLAAACHWKLPGYDDSYASQHNASPQIQVGDPKVRKYLHVHMWELHNHWNVPAGRRLRRNPNVCKTNGCINPHHWHLKPEHAAEFIKVGPKFNGPIQYGPDPGPNQLTMSPSEAAADPVTGIDGVCLSGPGSGPSSSPSARSAEVGSNHSGSLHNDSTSIDEFIEEIDGMRDLTEIKTYFLSRDLLTEGEVMKLFHQLPSELKERYEHG